MQHCEDKGHAQDVRALLATEGKPKEALLASLHLALELQLPEALVSPLKGALQIAEILNDTTSTKAQRTEQLQTQCQKDPVLIPCGFYLDSLFQPCLLLVTKDKDKDKDQYTVQKFSLFSADIDSGKRPLQQNYTLSPDQWQHCLEGLVELGDPSFPDASQLSRDAAKAASILSPSVGTPPDEKRASQDLIALLFSTVGAHPSHEPVALLAVTPSADPIKLIAKFCEAQPNEANTIYKQMVAQLHQHFQRSASSLTSKERERAFEQLERRQPDLGLTTQEQKLRALQATDKQRESKLLARPSSAPLQLQWREPLQTSGTTPTIPESVERDATCKPLQNGERPFSELAQQAQGIEKYLDQQHYTAARHLATDLLGHLPLACVEKDQRDVFCALIVQVCGQLFEAKLRLGDIW